MSRSPSPLSGAVGAGWPPRTADCRQFREVAVESGLAAARPPSPRPTSRWETPTPASRLAVPLRSGAAPGATRSRSTRESPPVRRPAPRTRIRGEVGRAAPRSPSAGSPQPSAESGEGPGVIIT